MRPRRGDSNFKARNGLLRQPIGPPLGKTPTNPDSHLSNSEVTRLRVDDVSQPLDRVARGCKLQYYPRSEHMIQCRTSGIDCSCVATFL